MVDQQASQLKALENLSRDASAKPIRLSYELIESITENFAHVIGRGGFGVVYLGVLANGEKVAVKKLSSITDLEEDLFTGEINSLIRSRHENIVRFFGFCADTHKELVPLNEKRYVLAEVRRRFLCFEYVPQGDLHRYLKEKAYRDEWRIRFQIIKGICQGLWYLHSEGICHLDIKPQNVLLDAHMTPKITDFGLSRYLDKSTITTIHIIGTPGYIPPENIDKGKISFKSDIFSLGIVIIKLLIGHDDMYDHKNWHESLDLHNLQVKTCVEIARKCTDGDQNKRPTISEIIQNLGLLKSQVPSNVPAEVACKVLCAHSGEVWFLHFSNNGKYLASASNDKTAVIWKVDEDGELLLKHTLTGHEKPVVMVAWSPDDCKLLTCGMDEHIRCWDVESGDCIHVYEKSGVGLMSCGWFPDGKQILASLSDQSFCLWDLDGKQADCWKVQRSSKSTDFAVSKDGNIFIMANTDSRILLFNRDAQHARLIEEEQTISSFSLSEDGDFLLVNLVNEQIHLWSIRNDPIRVKQYTGHKRRHFVIRSCFGGSEQAFIASGSEDAKVYIWHRASGDLIYTLSGHSGVVNCVSWNPTNPYMLASASDDHTVCIWGLKKTTAKRRGAGGSSSSNGST